MSTRALSIADLAGQGTGIFGSVTDGAPEPAPAPPVASADQITWAKLDDGWYVRIPSAIPCSSGDTVTVTKKDGSTVSAILNDPYRTVGRWQHWTAKQASKPQAKGERKANRYAGDCHHCGSRVAEGSGHLIRLGGGWGVEHRDGECATGREPEPEETTTYEEGRQGVETYREPIWPGLYTVTLPDGDHRTFKVEVQGHDAKFAPDATVVKYLSGRDNDNDYTGFAFIKNGKLQVWHKFRGRSGGEGSLVEVALIFATHPEAVQQAASRGETVYVEVEGYGQVAFQAACHCLRCGRTLSTPESITAHIGPECIKKGW